MRVCLKLSGVFLTCLFLVTTACDYGMSSSDAPKAPKFSSVKERQAWMIKTYLPWMEGYNWTYANVPRSDGRFLYELMIKTNRRNALEMGSANGYSAIWIGMAMEMTKGRLATIELDPEKAALCRSNIKNTGLSAVVDCIQGDALLKAPKLEGEFDFLFVDIGPVDVQPFVQAVEKKLSKDFIIALHNIGFAGNYEDIFSFAKSKGWSVESKRTDHGEGFFLITPKPMDI